MHVPDSLCLHGHTFGTRLTIRACLACFDGVCLIQDHDLRCQRLQLVLQLGDKIVAGDQKLKLSAFQLTVLTLQQNRNSYSVLLFSNVCM